MPIRQDPRTKRWYYRFYRGRSYFKGGFRTYEQAKEAERTKLNQVIDGGAYLEHPTKELSLADAGHVPRLHRMAPLRGCSSHGAADWRDYPDESGGHLDQFSRYLHSQFQVEPQPSRPHV